MHRLVSSTTALLIALSVPAYPPKSTLKTKRPPVRTRAHFSTRERIRHF
jgi:hypothetical protein